MQSLTWDDLLKLGKEMGEYAESIAKREPIGAADFAQLRAEQVLMTAFVCKRLDRIIELLERAESS